MKKRVLSILLKYGITVLIGFAMVMAVLDFHGFAEAASQVERYRILSDAFTIPGVILLMCGLLVFIANEGAFEGISYAVTYAVKMLIPGSSKEHERYGDYLERRREKGKAHGYGFLFITGGAFFLTAVLFILLFYSVYSK